MVVLIEALADALVEVLVEVLAGVLAGMTVDVLSSSCAGMIGVSAV